MDIVDTLRLENYFHIHVASDKLTADLTMIKRIDNEEMTFSLEELEQFIKEHGIIFGVDGEKLKEIVQHPNEHVYPVRIATGVPAVSGKDGYLNHELQSNENKDQKNNDRFNFWEVLKIPSVTAGETIATVIPPTEGQNGKDIFGEEINAVKGKPYKLRQGKNVRHDKESGAVIALVDGQISYGKRTVHVYPLYEVNGNLDLKTGNIDFVGSVVIRGDIPTGFTVKAKGDIQVYGLVEGAQLIAGGSVLITGGFMGMNRGRVLAGKDATISYVNQGTVHAEGNISVRKSILNSHCTAGADILVQSGAIIGGKLSAGRYIIASEIGNEVHAKTELFFGISQQILDRERAIKLEEKQLKDTILKLKALGEKLSVLETQNKLGQQEKLLLLKQKQSLMTAAEKYQLILHELEDIQEYLQLSDDTGLKVTGTIHPNVDVHFGKYRRKIKAVSKGMACKLIDSEIVLSPL